MKAVGVDLGASKILTALVNEKGKVLKSIKLETPKNREKLFHRLKDSIHAVSAGEKIAGIGIAAVGPLDVRKGVINKTPNIPFGKIELKKELRKEFRAPLFFDNDANAACLAEHLFGAIKGCRNAICLTLGTGLGSGAIINNELYSGKRGFAPEIGHMVIDVNGPRCGCGSRGCFECFVNSKSIKKRAAKAGLKETGPLAVELLARKGDKKARKVYEETGKWLGIGLANIANIFEPEVIVLGGGISNASQFLLPSAKKTMKENTLKEIFGSVEIRIAKLKDAAGAIGAAALVFRAKKAL